MPGADVQWVSGGADVVLKLNANGILALSASEQGDVKCAQPGKCKDLKRGTYLLTRPSGATMDTPSAAEKLTQSLHGIARSVNLLRLASRMSVASQDKGLKVSLEVQARGQTRRQPVTPESIPALKSGEVVTVKLENQSNRPLDVTLLYADARFGIGVLFPDAAGEVNRLEPDAVKAVDDIKISDTDGVFGIERLLVISVEATKQAERADFSFLAQPSLRDAKLTTTRGGPMAEDLQAFMDAGFADYRTRGMPQRMPSSKTGMQVFTFNVQPDAAPAAR